MTEWIDFTELAALIGAIIYFIRWQKDVEFAFKNVEEKFSDLDEQLNTLNTLAIERDNEESKTSDS